MEIPIEIIELAEKRKEAKTNKDYSVADALRDEIINKGYQIDDVSVENNPNGFVIIKR